MKNIFILILYYNGSRDLSECLPTLKWLKSKKYSLHTVVIDNASNAQEKKKLQNLLRAHPYIKLIENNQNFGFAGGNNVGIKYAMKRKADFVILLNNDTKIESNFVERGLKINCGILSPVVKFKEFKDKPKFIYDMGGVVNWWTGRTAHINAYRDEYLKKVKDLPKEVDYVAGCCMMIRKDVIEKIGLLEEEYFIYFEDVDYCITAKKAGFNVKVDPGATIYHKLGGSMDRWSGRAIYHNLLSNFIFINRHLGLRKITGWAYLFILAMKISRDYLFARIKGNEFWKIKKMWRGARHEFNEK